MNGAIDWNKFSAFFSPLYEVEYDLILANWEQKEKEFNGKKKIVLDFSVLSINGVDVSHDMKISFSGGNAVKFKNIVEEARRNKYTTINVRFVRHPDKKIDVADMRQVRRIVEGVQ